MIRTMAKGLELEDRPPRGGGGTNGEVGLPEPPDDDAEPSDQLRYLCAVVPHLVRVTARLDSERERVIAAGGHAKRYTASVDTLSKSIADVGDTVRDLVAGLQKRDEHFVELIGAPPEPDAPDPKRRDGWGMRLALHQVHAHYRSQRATTVGLGALGGLAAAAAEYVLRRGG